MGSLHDVSISLKTIRKIMKWGDPIAFQLINFIDAIYTNVTNEIGTPTRFPIH